MFNICLDNNFACLFGVNFSSLNIPRLFPPRVFCIQFSDIFTFFFNEICVCKTGNVKVLRLISSFEDFLAYRKIPGMRSSQNVKQVRKFSFNHLSNSKTGFTDSRVQCERKSSKPMHLPLFLFEQGLLYCRPQRLALPVIPSSRGFGPEWLGQPRTWTPRRRRRLG